MPVEITILSGSRRAAQVHLDTDEFQVGTTPGCTVAFDAALDPAAAGQSATFALREDGWWLTNTGSKEMLVNHLPIAGRHRLRSGDIVRLSSEGPDFSFAIVPPRKPVPSQIAGQPAEVRNPVVSEVAASAAGDRRRPRMAILALSGAAAVALCCLAFWLLTRDSGTAKEAVASAEVESPAPSVSSAATSAVAMPEQSAQQPAAAVIQARRGAPDQSESAPPEPPVQGDTSAVPGAFDQVLDSVALLTVEHPQGAASWPFGTACVIRENALLTTATVALELAKFRRAGWKVWAMGKAANGKQAIDDVRVHVGYVKAADNREEQIYFDLALLTPHGNLEHLCPLADLAESDEVESGFPVACVGIPHEGDLMNRFDEFKPEVILGKVFVVTALQPSPSAPRLIHVQAQLPRNMYGSPLVNKQGHLLGVYAESTPEGADLRLHYFLQLGGLTSGSLDQDRPELWIAPPLGEDVKTSTPGPGERP